MCGVRIASIGTKKQACAIIIRISSTQKAVLAILGKAAIGRCSMRIISVLMEKGKTMQIREMGLSKWATNCLYRAGITTVEELRQKRTWELQSIPSFGAKCLREALDRLDAEKPMTHADQIRAMNDEELAKVPRAWSGYSCVFPDRYCEDGMTCEKCLLEWLQQPAEEG